MHNYNVGTSFDRHEIVVVEKCVVDLFEVKHTNIPSY